MIESAVADMVQDPVPKVAAGERTEAGLALAGIVATVGTAYYAGRTGSWEPLMATSMGLALVVLFVTAAQR